MLQVALAPALIALSKGPHRRRALLEAAVEIVREADLVAGTAHQRRFDEIVTEDFASQRSVARQDRQIAMFHEGSDANNRVMSPIVAVALRPQREAFEKYGAVNSRGKLLNAGKE